VEIGEAWVIAERRKRTLGRKTSGPQILPDGIAQDERTRFLPPLLHRRGIPG
jgi:hypothetical protein